MPNSRDLLKESTDLLRGAGIPSPRNEALLLASFAFSLSRETLLLEERHLDEPSSRRFRELVKERSEKRTPIPYLTGTAGFLDLDLIVTPDVLIPRPATETLLELALEVPALRAADIGTGSGAIAVALAIRRPELEITAIDISSGALAVARENARKYGVEDRITFREGSLAAPLGEAVDLLCSNPPYIRTSDLPALAPEIAHEPPLALDGGPDGLDLIRPLLEESRSFLRPGGTLLMEIGHDQSGTVLELADSLGWVEGVVHPDLEGIPRILEATLPVE